jgi:hypothetical protein
MRILAGGGVALQLHPMLRMCYSILDTSMEALGLAAGIAAICRTPETGLER